MKFFEDKNAQKRWVGCEIETHFFGDDRKISREERKVASAKDRSKYKKTDKDQKEKREKELNESDLNLPEGRVLSITPSGFLVEYENQLITCGIKGALKKEKNQLKNLVTVGDIVKFELLSNNEGRIAFVLERTSVLSRADNLSRRKEQLIAANIDLVLITVSVVSPALKPYLVDRYIIATEKGNMKPVIVINKIDLLNKESPEQIEFYEDFLNAYRKTAIPVISVSSFTGEGIEELKSIMKDKASVFSGQSGVGKSSLIAKITGEDLKTGHIVEHTGKGSHTTTTANLIPLSFGGWCIDTPGIKSFGIWNLSKEEIREYFSEFFEASQECKFHNCTHTHENNCNVIAAVENGNISAMRYQSYLNLLESIEAEHLRR